MNWRFKALLQQAFSQLPYRETLNYLGQRYLTRTYPRPDDDYESVKRIAREHIAVAQRHSPRSLDRALFYEFGAGWDLLSPLVFYCFGVEQQIVTDLRPHLRTDLVNEIIGRLQAAAPEAGVRRRPDTRFNGSPTKLLTGLRARYGIDYRAPVDARHTGLPSGSMNFVSSTNTLEHVPLAEIGAILTECRRILSDDGIMSFWIDYQDHYSYFDQTITVYNFLRYPASRWVLYNPPIMYQNRLRHVDYLKLFESVDLEIVEEHPTLGSQEDLAILRRLPLAEPFRHYQFTDLAIRNSLIVLRKRKSG